MSDYISNSSLGKKTPYINSYSPELLFPILRSQKRIELGIKDTIPFYGFDLWNAYEISWLNQKGKPMVGLASFSFPCQSPKIIESKSMKLYLNSFNQTHVNSIDKVKAMLSSDLSKACGSEVIVSLSLLNEAEIQIASLSGNCIDNIDIECHQYTVDSSLLKVGHETTSEKVYSNLLKSNCLVTGQPDWASLEIQYKGANIDHAGLLQYIVSYREHQEFHEQCVERIFMDISNMCRPKELTVTAYFTRRGGLDINPVRSTLAKPYFNHRHRLIRQ